MIIKVNDRIRVGALEGTVTHMSIGVLASDPAGELGPSVDEYEMDLDYQGAVSYTTDSGDAKWAYFDQIEDVLS